MKKLTLVILIFALIQTAQAQSKLSFGIKAGAQYVDPKLYEFYDPFPFYKYDQSRSYSLTYGETSAVSGINLGGYLNYALLKNGRVALNLEFDFNRKGYAQRDILKNFTNPTQPYLIIKKNYLDIPVSIKLQPFRNTGIFIETGVYQAFLLSRKTRFPSTDNNSTEFEKRRSRALLRETNLTGFKVGAGWNFKKFDLSGYYQTDKQYEYIQFGIRCPFTTLFYQKN